jgi:hypothetical protein
MDYTKVSSKRWECISATVVKSDARAVVLTMDAADMAVILDLETKALDEGLPEGQDRELLVGACTFDPEHGPVVVLAQGERVSSLRAGPTRRDVLIRVVEAGSGPGVVRLRWRVRSCRPAPVAEPEAAEPEAEAAARAEAEAEAAREHALESIRDVLETAGKLRDRLELTGAEADREAPREAEEWLGARRPADHSDEQS